MKDPLKTNSRRRWRAVFLISAVILSSAALAQDHDLVMEAVSATPDPLQRGCSAALSASFRVNGLDDFDVPSGGVKINFKWADGSLDPATASWTNINDLGVTLAAGEVLAITQVWPDDFTAAGTSLGWTVPSTPASVHIRAEVGYTDTSIVDAEIADNVLVETFPTAEGSCPPVAPTCVRGPLNLWICWKDIFEIDPRIVTELRCLTNPEECFRPPLCRWVDCPPCLNGLSCPPEPFELLIAAQSPELRISLIAGNQEIARAEPMKRPIRDGNRVFNYRLVFTPEKKVAYRIGIMPGKGTKLGVPLTIDTSIRPLRGVEAKP